MRLQCLRCTAIALVLLTLGCAAPGTRPGDQPDASPPQSAAPSVVITPTGDGDTPPNHADNNDWKQRNELTAAEQRLGEDLAARIRPRLETLRAAGDFAPASTRQVLLDAGISADMIEVAPIRTPLGQSTPPPGVVYAVRFGQAGCVVGDVRPDRVLVEIRGAAAEFGYLEPFSH